MLFHITDFYVVLFRNTNDNADTEKAAFDSLKKYYAIPDDVATVEDCHEIHFRRR